MDASILQIIDTVLTALMAMGLLWLVISLLSDGLSSRRRQHDREQSLERALSELEDEVMVLRAARLEHECTKISLHFERTQRQMAEARAERYARELADKATMPVDFYRAGLRDAEAGTIAS